ncbi:MAG: STAS domain-containing protein [Candidatus Methanomethylophilaceae archaeon]
MAIAKNGNKIEATVVGKLDTATSPAFEAEMAKYLDDNTDEIVLDLKDSIYISSAGLRVILALEKKMENVDGSLRIINVPDLIMEVFTETGLSDILALE